MNDFYFFKHWTILQEAIASNQQAFVINYLKTPTMRRPSHTYGGHNSIGNLLMETAAKYGRCWFNILSKYYCHSGKPFHHAIKHKQYKWIKSYIDECRRLPKQGLFLAEQRNHFWKYRNNHGNNIIGIAIECNDLEALKFILKLQKDSNVCQTLLLDIDDFVWCGNTAIQAAFILCSDNFQMLKYLLQTHKPNYKGFNITQLDESDPYLVWKSEIKTRLNGEPYEHVFRDGLKGPITFKPDCEGLTIDERIEMCQTSNALTSEQCQTLKNILKKRRKLCGVGGGDFV